VLRTRLGLYLCSEFIRAVSDPSFPFSLIGNGDGVSDLTSDSILSLFLGSRQDLVHFHKTDLDFQAATARALAQAWSRRCFALATRWQK
jgi:hypothetical protein